MAADVVDGLLRKYLVETTAQRVAAYRRYREQSGVYWTVKGLERVHWRPLYELVHSMAFHGSLLCHFLRFSDARGSSMSFKTLLLTVIPKRYYCQSSVFQRNTKMVSPAKLMVSPAKLMVSPAKLIFSKWVFQSIIKLTGVCQNTASDSNTETVLLSKQCFSKKYQNGITF